MSKTTLLTAVGILIAVLCFVALRFAVRHYGTDWHWALRASLYAAHFLAFIAIGELIAKWRQSAD